MWHDGGHDLVRYFPTLRSVLIKSTIAKITITDRNGGGGELGIFAGTLVGGIFGGGKVCGRISEIEAAIVIQNFDGDVEGCVGGGRVGITARGSNAIDEVVLDIKKGTLVECVAVGYEEYRPAAQLETGTVIEKVDGTVEGYIVMSMLPKVNPTLLRELYLCSDLFSIAPLELVVGT